ncbi:MAG: hypothetical protein WEF50_09530 [Myxococcota bacterium]
MLPICTLNEVRESKGTARVFDGFRAPSSLYRHTGEEANFLDAARGIAISCLVGVACWLLLGALLYGFLG